MADEPTARLALTSTRLANFVLAEPWVLQDDEPGITEEDCWDSDIDYSTTWTATDDEITTWLADTDVATDWALVPDAEC